MYDRWFKMDIGVVHDLETYERIVRRTNEFGPSMASTTADELLGMADDLREPRVWRSLAPARIAELFALVREVAARTVDMRPYDVQILAAAAMADGKLAEMDTGEGKTLAAVLPAALHAFRGNRVHILTFNDYLARRDCEWMGPIFSCLGLETDFVDQSSSREARRRSYRADITYVTAKEAGFDYLRDGLAISAKDRVHSGFTAAIVDEADSILIDEARTPLVIAGPRKTSGTDPYRISAIVRELRETKDWETDEFRRNVYLTECGLKHVEEALGCENLHAARNERLLTEVNQALHARVLLVRDDDYIVRDDRIEIVDEFTGRVTPDRRWPDGLQAALEAKEGVPVQPAGRILGTATMHHFISAYDKLSGMTATAQSSAVEFHDRYGLDVVPIPPHKPSRRTDEPDRVFTHVDAKERAIVDEVRRARALFRPVLVGTGTVAESERIAGLLEAHGVCCEVLNARNDAEEARIISDAGAPGAVTISTNMAGRGVDIRLGGRHESERECVVGLGGLLVIGTNRHESRRIDEQLRGRAGRQGDPGTTRYFVSLEDPIMRRFGIDELIPRKLRPPKQSEPLSLPRIQREIDRIQRIAHGQNRDIRRTLARYSAILERQSDLFSSWRNDILTGRAAPEEILAEFDDVVWKPPGEASPPEKVFRRSVLVAMDEVWADHLAFAADVREGIHLLAIGGLDPLTEYHQRVAAAFETVPNKVRAKVRAAILDLDPSATDTAPASTWTYLIDDRALTDLQQMLHGPGSGAFSAGAALMTWPLLLVWAAWKRFKESR